MISILVVEDDKDERNIIAKYLSEFFLNVICCSTAEEALEIIKSNKDIQLIILDLNLPGFIMPPENETGFFGRKNVKGKTR